MTLQEIIDRLNLTVLTEKKDFTAITPSGVYASDLLSCVMAGAHRRGLWITLQSHVNIVAVAALLDLSAVIITEGSTPEPDVIQKANREEVTLLLTPAPTYTVAGKLWELGLREG
ncbi:MAG: serine kinase [Chloroflexi bacterium]|nr:MAG: serine kinase [Chloroflexota bacterium]